MPKITLDIPQSAIDEINKNLQIINNCHPNSILSAHDIGREAIAVYKWVTDQTSKGHAVVSANKNKEFVFQIETPNIPAKNPTK